MPASLDAWAPAAAAAAKEIAMQAPFPVVMDEVDVDGMVSRGVRLVGKAKRQTEGKYAGRWTCLADVGGALCLVEVTIQVDAFDSRQG